MSRWGYRDYPKPGPRRAPPQRGIRLKKAGVTWWGKRWIEALERASREYSNRLPRGRSYARAGCVHDLEIRAGQVTARVTGSRATPYRVSISLAVLNEARWGRTIEAMSAQALYGAELLAGRMPEGIDQAFAGAGCSLFITKSDELKTDCSCPDWANPCKHIAATHYVLAEAFDRDPFLLFELRGRKRDQVLAEVHARRAGLAAVAPKNPKEPADEEIRGVALRKFTPADYESADKGVPALAFRFEPPATFATTLRQLGKPNCWNSAQTLEARLGSLIHGAADRAREVAQRDSAAVADVEQVLRSRRGRADLRKFDAIMKRNGGMPPREGDEV